MLLIGVNTSLIRGTVSQASQFWITGKKIIQPLMAHSSSSSFKEKNKRGLKCLTE